ncbi:hypothetical protein FQN60_002645 [Etheostoma spectabile]|uniref:Uncharacterized protein n=1 Tax=Etheostoma spectabile TaxID=54343 RepID=A0A5J5CGU6_9PERO|nr:hypothetical protein FQN60_002645 [Etheostoma spectabile]
MRLTHQLAIGPLFPALTGAQSSYLLSCDVAGGGVRRALKYTGSSPEIGRSTQQSKQLLHRLLRTPVSRGKQSTHSGVIMIKKMSPTESEFDIPAKNCYRMVILGSTKVGKTAIVSRFLNGRFEEQYTPTIEDFHRKLYSIKGDVYQLDILDTSGNHPFPAMRRLSILTGDVFILVFSLDNRDSFRRCSGSSARYSRPSRA